MVRIEVRVIVWDIHDVHMGDYGYRVEGAFPYLDAEFGGQKWEADKGLRWDEPILVLGRHSVVARSRACGSQSRYRSSEEEMAGEMLELPKSELS